MTGLAPQGGRLLLYVPVPLHEDDQGNLVVEAQAANGRRLWAENFAHVTFMHPLSPDPAPDGAVPVTAIPGADRVETRAIPMAYRPDRFLRHLPSARRMVRAEIEKADHLCFALGGLFGDWGAVAAIEASRMGRKFAVWTDRVESEVTRHQAAGNGRHALRARLTWRAMATLERFVIRRADLGLFHGLETFEAYAPHCRQSELVHDIHVAQSDHIQPKDLAKKLATVADGPLRIVYAGRAETMKGPLDWVSVLAELHREGLDFQAIWLGDGGLLGQIRQRIADEGLAGKVSLPGMVSSHAAVLAELRRAHVFLFCHQTPESPRCLIEALLSGTPIIGYDSAYPADLVSQHDGGRFVPRGDVAGLASMVAGLGQDRTDLADLIARAARDGAPFHDASVFAHRSSLIRRYA